MIPIVRFVSLCLFPLSIKKGRLLQKIIFISIGWIKRLVIFSLCNLVLKHYFEKKLRIMNDILTIRKEKSELFVLIIQKELLLSLYLET